MDERTLDDLSPMTRAALIKTMEREGNRYDALWHGTMSDEELRQAHRSYRLARQTAQR